MNFTDPYPLFPVTSAAATSLQMTMWAEGGSRKGRVSMRRRRSLTEADDPDPPLCPKRLSLLLFPKGPALC